MRRTFAIAVPALIIIGFAAAFMACTDMGEELVIPVPPNPEDTLTVWADVSPIFQVNCVTCHGGNGGLFLDTYQHAITTGLHGPVVIAGDSNGSLLYQAITGTTSIVGQMPQGGMLSATEILNIANWIDDGILENPPPSP